MASTPKSRPKADVRPRVGVPGLILDFGDAGFTNPASRESNRRYPSIRLAPDLGTHAVMDLSKLPGVPTPAQVYLWVDRVNAPGKVQIAFGVDGIPFACPRTGLDAGTIAANDAARTERVNAEKAAEGEI